VTAKSSLVGVVLLTLIVVWSKTFPVEGQEELFHQSGGDVCMKQRQGFGQRYYRVELGAQGINLQVGLNCRDWSILVPVKWFVVLFQSNQ